MHKFQDIKNWIDETIEIGVSVGKGLAILGLIIIMLPLVILVSPIWIAVFLLGLVGRGIDKLLKKLHKELDAIKNGRRTTKR